jgi:hypothetical protein
VYHGHPGRDCCFFCVCCIFVFFQKQRKKKNTGETPVVHTGETPVVHMGETPMLHSQTDQTPCGLSRERGSFAFWTGVRGWK